MREREDWKRQERKRERERVKGRETDLEINIPELKKKERQT